MMVDSVDIVVFSPETDLLFVEKHITRNIVLFGLVYCSELGIITKSW